MKPGLHVCLVCGNPNIRFEPKRNETWWCFGCASGGRVIDGEMTCQIVREPWMPIQRLAEGDTDVSFS